jgi:hypothetical protein
MEWEEWQPKMSTLEPQLIPPRPLWQRLILSEEERRRYPTASPWTGGPRWFSSPNVVDLYQYRSPVEKERIRAVLLGRTLRFA